MNVNSFLEGAVSVARPYSTARGSFPQIAVS
jgi:hypothetical protein